MELETDDHMDSPPLLQCHTGSTMVVTLDTKR